MILTVDSCMKLIRSCPSHFFTSLPQLATSVAGATTTALRATGVPCITSIKAVILLTTYNIQGAVYLTATATATAVCCPAAYVTYCDSMHGRAGCQLQRKGVIMAAALQEYMAWTNCHRAQLGSERLPLVLV
eukprot:GHUV01032335.1.p1 GENE.GHUV01032335.1~~GHUV01032335.1.p1  ORF type:complete len:132 (+),score=17.21 GHUV01032335.1:672-1067(+)